MFDLPPSPVFVSFPDHLAVQLERWLYVAPPFAPFYILSAKRISLSSPKTEWFRGCVGAQQ
jgi:hypothetical protein